MPVIPSNLPPVAPGFSSKPNPLKEIVKSSHVPQEGQLLPPVNESIEWVVEEIQGTSEIGEKEKAARDVINVQAVFDKTIKDLLGFKPNAPEEEVHVTDERFLRAVYASSENPVELAEKLSEASGNLQELLDKHPFISKALKKEDEIVADVEKIFKILLGLPEEATRDEIKEAIKPYLQ